MLHLLIIFILFQQVKNEHIYLHPKLTDSFSYQYSSKYSSLKNHEQYLHPVLYQLLNLDPKHESTFYSLDNKENPIVIFKNSTNTFSRIGQLAIPAMMLAPYQPSVVYARIFTTTNRLSICGDGILDTSNSETCEFMLSKNSDKPFLAVVPPPNYHLPWVKDKNFLRPVQRECLWAPGRVGSCSTRDSFGGIQKTNIPSSIFSHYCGDGVLDISPSSSFIDQLLVLLNDKNSEYRQFYTICGYIDEHCLLPIYCSEGRKPWIIKGKTIRFTQNSTEECDLGEILNGAIRSGCTSDCLIRCSYKRGGRVNWDDYPRLGCIQPCLNELWKGIYCDTPNCFHGTPNSQDGGCYSCDRGWTGPTCSTNVCGNGRVASWINTTPICFCNPGWYGVTCNESYCSSWTDEGICLECIPGKRDPSSFCIQDACVFGEKDPTSGIKRACKQPCTVPFFFGKFCNETKCTEWDQNNFVIEGELKCLKCLSGYDLPYCKPSVNDGKNYSRCLDPWSFGPDCSQRRKKKASIKECIPGWAGPYCSLFACVRGFPDFSHPHLQCIPGSCVPGWGGKWCENSLLVLIDNFAKYQDWTKTRTLVYKYYLNLVKLSSSGHVLKQWKDFAVKIVTGDRPTAIVSLNTNNQQLDWDENIPNTGFIRVYLSEKEKVWVHLKPDPSVYNALENINYEMKKYIQVLQRNNLYLGAIKGLNHDIPMEKKCLYGIPSEISPFKPCMQCSPGWFNAYCDETHCIKFSPDHASCISCKPGYEGDFCQLSIIGKKLSTECDEGWSGSNCHIPRCLYGYRFVSPTLNFLQTNKNEQRLTNSSTDSYLFDKAYLPDVVSIKEVYRVERTWIEKFSLCAISQTELNKTFIDLKMHQITKVSFHLWLCDGIPLRSEADPKCSACYPGFDGEYCDKRLNEAEIMSDCRDYCVRGQWDWTSGSCYICFSGSYGESCEKSYCQEWWTSNFTCKHCEMVPYSDINSKSSSFKSLSKTTAKLSLWYGQRFGDFCEFRGLCAFGDQAKSDEGCTFCHSPCIIGPYCNETRCKTFTNDPVPVCASCQTNWKGFCCLESTLSEKRFSKASFLKSVFSSCKSLGYIGWPNCQSTRCSYGVVDPDDKQYYKCLPGSCFPGWSGPWCSFALWNSEERTLFHQDNLLKQLKIAAKVDLSLSTSNAIGLFHGKRIVAFSGLLFSDSLPMLFNPVCSLPALSDYYCNERFCKHGISSSDNIQECESCFPGWIGPFCNETHRKNPFLYDDPYCQDGWYSPIFCDKKSLCTSLSLNDCPMPGGISYLYSENCLSCSCPTFFKGPFCNQSTCVHGTPAMKLDSGGGCIQGSCLSGWKGIFCNESACIHGYRTLTSGNIIEDNVYSYFPFQRWSYGWKGIGRIMRPVSLNSTIKYYDGSLEKPECTACYPGYPQRPFCDEIFHGDTSPCIHGWFDQSIGVCSECFPGWAGASCNESSCIQWLLPYVKCTECKSGLYGPLCQYKSHCVHGLLNNRSFDGSCHQPCLLRYFNGVFCNETKCLVKNGDGIPTLTSKGQCIGCINGYSGPYCSIKPSCINGLASIILETSSSVPGICIPGSCDAGWVGTWCHQRAYFRPSSLKTPNECEDGWTGSFCDIPDCKHGAPDYIYGWCRWCHPGFTAKDCNSKPCLFGIPNLLHQPLIDSPEYKSDLELYSPACIPGTCLDSWNGPACATPSCFGESSERSKWNAPSDLWYALFGTWLSTSENSPLWFSTPNQSPSGTNVKGIKQPISDSYHSIMPVIGGTIPGIDWNTLECTGCSYPYYRAPVCNGINRCVWGILDEASSDGRCIPSSCQRGGGPFCSTPICEHGIPDPLFTLGCYKCYPGWMGYSSDIQTWDSISFIEDNTPSVFDLSYDSLPILICNIPTCINGWMHFLHPATVDPHSYICICFDGWTGQNCDITIAIDTFSRSISETRPGCPEFICPPILNMSLDCPYCNDSNSVVVVELAPRTECPNGTIDSLFVDLYLKENNVQAH